MKNTFLICLFALFAFSGCVDDEEDFATGGNISPELTPENKTDAELNVSVFEQLNLDYPGLEQVKQYYEAGENYLAASALLEYYRTRTNVTNPNLSLVDVTITDDDQLKADYALEDYRFHVNNFYESADDKKPYSVKKDGAIDWSYSPKGASDEYQKQLHRHQWFIPQAKAYYKSKDEKYINSWIEVYGNWITANPKPETGTNETSWWQLQVASRLNDQVELLEYFKNSTNFTPEWLTTFLASFAEQADFLVQYPYAQSGNILITQGGALANAGVLMPEFKNAETWKNTGYNTLGAEVKNQFMTDGWHKEMSLHYHISAIADFYNAMKLAQENNQPNLVSNDFSTYLRKAAEVVMYFTYPNYFRKSKGGLDDYVVPSFNDSWKSNWNRSTLSRNFRRYVELFPDSEEFKYMASAVNGGTTVGNTPGNGLKLFEDAGFYIMRNGWAPSSTVMILSNNKSNDISTSMDSWSHNQADNGTFELYINGRNFFPDSGVCTYYTSGGDNELRNWFRGTDKHNTLTLKDMNNPQKEWKKNISKADGKLLFSEEGSTETIVFENQGYPDLKHRRAVFFVNKEFFVLVDEAIGNINNPVYLSFNLCEGSDSEIVIDKDKKGAHTDFSDKNNIIVRTFSDTGKNIELRPFNTDGSYTGRIAYAVDGNFKERNSYTIYSAKAADENVRFITVILPVNGNTSEKDDITAEFNGSYSDNGASVKVTVNGAEHTLSYTLN